MLNFKCIDDLRGFFVKAFPQAKLAEDFTINTEKCPPGMNGDITLNCFRLAKPLKSSPDKIADAAVEMLNNHDDVAQVEKVKAFVNVTLTAAAIHRSSLGNIEALLNAVVLPEAKRKKIVIEYSAPNTNKPQHLGHVRNNTLGMSLAALLARVGHDVKPINLVNDRGIHICKSMLAYQRLGDGITPESSDIKGDHLVGQFYVKYNNLLNEELAELKKAKPELADKSNEDLFLETELGQATQKMLQDWEKNDPAVRELWLKMNKWVFAGFDETYHRMGIKFDHTYLESNTYLLGKDLINQGVDNGTFTLRADGAIIADLGKLGEKVVLRSDGTSVYITQDIGTTLKKHEDYQPDEQIWVVGDEQIFHFKVLFAILKKMGYEWADNLFHLAYGMVNLPSGKMKSREGTVVDADDLFENMVELAKKSTLERCGEDIPEDIDERSEIIGMGALKFMLLKFNPKTTMMFDPQASVKFEGDTGPYVQYACARISSIERKAAAQGIKPADNLDWALADSEAEKSLSAIAFLYPQVLQLSAERKDCSGLVNYLLDLAKAFNRFYRECPVLVSENSDAIRDIRLAICHRVRMILADGLKTLTIGIPESM